MQRRPSRMSWRRVLWQGRRCRTWVVAQAHAQSPVGVQVDVWCGVGREGGTSLRLMVLPVGPPSTWMRCLRLACLSLQGAGRGPGQPQSPRGLQAAVLLKGMLLSKCQWQALAVAPRLSLVVVNVSSVEGEGRARDTGRAASARAGTPCQAGAGEGGSAAPREPWPGCAPPGRCRLPA